MPPRTSRPTVEPRSEILKKASSPEGDDWGDVLTRRILFQILARHGTPPPRIGHVDPDPAPPGASARGSVGGVQPPENPPTEHEIGKRTFLVADVEPLDVDGVRTLEVGTALWLLAFVALLPFYKSLQDDDR